MQSTPQWSRNEWVTRKDFTRAVTVTKVDAETLLRQFEEFVGKDLSKKLFSENDWQVFLTEKYGKQHGNRWCSASKKFVKTCSTKKKKYVENKEKRSRLAAIVRYESDREDRRQERKRQERERPKSQRILPWNP